MPELTSTVVQADITGSTSLYERLGDAAASSMINDCLAVLRSVISSHGGEVVSHKGDDVLALFADPKSSFDACREILALHKHGPIRLHLGAHWGPVIVERGDVFGDTVNVTARLASLANSGELLCSQQLFQLLPPEAGRGFRSLGAMVLKGRRESVHIHSLPDDSAYLTRLPDSLRSPEKNEQAPALLFLRWRDRTLICEEGSGLSIGRSEECSLVLQWPWVSRCHATVSLRNGQVHLHDTSTSGTHVRVPAGECCDLFVHRTTATLFGTGMISPALPISDPMSDPISYHFGRS